VLALALLGRLGAARQVGGPGVGGAKGVLGRGAAGEAAAAGVSAWDLAIWGVWVAWGPPELPAVL